MTLTRRSSFAALSALVAIPTLFMLAQPAHADRLDPMADAAAMARASDEAGNELAELDEAEMPEGYVRMPGGFFSHRDCNHEIPEGSTVDPDRNVLDRTGKAVMRLPECDHRAIRLRGSDFRQHARRLNSRPDPSVPNSNWMSAVEQDLPPPTSTTAPIEWNLINANVTVPHAYPGNTGTLFYFNALTPSSGNEILQPVLSWGPATCNRPTANSWQISSYHCAPSGNGTLCTCTTPQYVGYDDTLIFQAYMVELTTLGSSQYWKWAVIAQDSTKNVSSNSYFYLPTGSSTVMKNYYPAVYEQYNNNQCSPNVFFSGISQSAWVYPKSATTMNWVGNNAYTAGCNTYPSCFACPQFTSTGVYVGG